MIEFRRYLQLFVLHQIEYGQHTQKEILHIHLSVMRYSLRDLPPMLDAQWSEPEKRDAQVRELVVPRLERLLSDENLQQQTLQQNWHPYQLLREQNAVPQLPPAHVMKPDNISDSTGFNQRIDQLERLLHLTRVAMEVTTAGMVLWRNWRALRDERQLLIHAVSNTIHGQERALQLANNEDFVRGYLSEHGNDPAHPIIFKGNQGEL